MRESTACSRVSGAAVGRREKHTRYFQLYNDCMAGDLVDISFLVEPSPRTRAWKRKQIFRRNRIRCDKSTILRRRSEIASAVTPGYLIMAIRFRRARYQNYQSKCKATAISRSAAVMRMVSGLHSCGGFGRSRAEVCTKVPSGNGETTTRKFLEFRVTPAKSEPAGRRALRGHRVTAVLHNPISRCACAVHN